MGKGVKPRRISLKVLARNETKKKNMGNKASRAITIPSTRQPPGLKSGSAGETAKPYIVRQRAEAFLEEMKIPSSGPAKFYQLQAEGSLFGAPASLFLSLVLGVFRTKEGSLYHLTRAMNAKGIAILQERLEQITQAPHTYTALEYAAIAGAAQELKSLSPDRLIAAPLVQRLVNHLYQLGFTAHRLSLPESQERLALEAFLRVARPPTAPVAAANKPAGLFAAPVAAANKPAVPSAAEEDGASEDGNSEQDLEGFEEPASPQNGDGKS